MQRVLAAVLVLLAASLAGCLAGEGEPVEPAAEPSNSHMRSWADAHVAG